MPNPLQWPPLTLVSSIVAAPAWSVTSCSYTMAVGSFVTVGGGTDFARYIPIQQQEEPRTYPFTPQPIQQAEPILSKPASIGPFREPAQPEPAHTLPPPSPPTPKRWRWRG